MSASFSIPLRSPAHADGLTGADSLGTPTSPAPGVASTQAKPTAATTLPSPYAYPDPRRPSSAASSPACAPSTRHALASPVHTPLSSAGGSTKATRPPARIDFEDPVLHANLEKLSTPRSFDRLRTDAEGKLHRVSRWRLRWRRDPEAARQRIGTLVRAINDNIDKLDGRVPVSMRQQIERLFIRCMSRVPTCYFPRSLIAPDSALERVLNPRLHQLRAEPPSDERSFELAVEEARFAIALGIRPVPPHSGSSGSYFVHDRQGKRLGLFKPADEEPYEPNNPNPRKQILRTCAPCVMDRRLHGRTVLSGQGYLSEAAASLVARRLGLDELVPYTGVASLGSAAFSYSAPRWSGCCEGRRDTDGDARDERSLTDGYPPKRGSLQLFLHGFRDSSQVLPRARADASVRQSLQDQFQLMTVLDVIIGNTDRKDANWMLKHDPEAGTLQLGAIDHGLAFPVGDFSAYRFAWLRFPEAAAGYSEATRAWAEKWLTDEHVHPLMAELEKLMRTDSRFDEASFKAQKTLMLDRIDNARKCVAAGETPAQLTNAIFCSALHAIPAERAAARLRSPGCLPRLVGPKPPLVSSAHSANGSL